MSVPEAEDSLSSSDVVIRVQVPDVQIIVIHLLLVTAEGEQLHLNVFLGGVLGLLLSCSSHLCQSLLLLASPFAFVGLSNIISSMNLFEIVN